MNSKFILLSFLFFIACMKNNDLGPTDESFPVPQLLGNWDVKKVETANSKWLPEASRVLISCHYYSGFM